VARIHRIRRQRSLSGRSRQIFHRLGYGAITTVQNRAPQPVRKGSTALQDLLMMHVIQAEEHFTAFRAHHAPRKAGLYREAERRPNFLGETPSSGNLILFKQQTAGNLALLLLQGGGGQPPNGQRPAVKSLG
jgi:hypothetical protein